MERNIQILSSEATSSSPIFRHFNRVNFSRQNIENRKDEVGLDIRFSGVHGNSYADENWEEVVVVVQHDILIGCYRAFSSVETDYQCNELRQIWYTGTYESYQCYKCSQHLFLDAILPGQTGTDYKSALEFRELSDFQNVPIIHGRYEADQKCCSFILTDSGMSQVTAINMS